MENQNQVPPQTQPAVSQVPTSSTPQISPEQKHKGKIWKIIGIILICIVVIFSLLAWYGNKLNNQSLQTNNSQEKNMNNQRQIDPEKVFEDPKVIALAGAINAGNLSEIESALREGVNVKTVGEKGFTVTHFALLADANAPDIMRLLLKAGADPISRLEDGNDVPYYAAARDNADPAVVAALLDFGVSASQTVGIERLSWLQAAISGRNMPVVRLLLQRGADINYNHPFNGTALHFAGVVPDYDIMVFLLDHGANPHLRDNQSPEIAADVPRYTPAEAYCRFESGKTPNPTPKQLAGFEAMKQAFARSGVALKCGI